MNKLRKAFTIGLMSLTVLSMSVVVAPQTKAAQAGDLIKMDGLSSVYYLGADNKRYVFPNEATYFSWYSDFSGVVTVSQSELESYPLGANVTVRPGTKLVKITTNPTVYAVEPGGNLVAIPDEATAKALYGDNWAQRVIDVPDAFFTNYTITSKTVSATAYPTGSLVKFGDNPDVYYIDADGKARKFADEAAFLANRFKWSDVITSSLDLPELGTEITGAESALTDTSSGAGGTAEAGTGVSVSIASDTPAAGNIPAGSPNEYLKFNITASSDGDVQISQITLNAYDLGDATNIDDVTIYVDGVKQGTSKNMTSDRLATFNFSTPITVPAGTTKSLTVKATIASGTTGGNYAIGIASASNIKTNGAVVSGSFPIIGNSKAIVTGVDIGTVTMSSVSNDSTTNDFGEDDVLLSSFNLSVANEPVIWKSARFKNGGTNKTDLVTNLRIVVDGDEVVSGASLVDKYVDFDMNNFVIAKGDTVTVEVYGDLGIGSSGDTIKLYIKNANDFSFVGEDYGYGVEISDITSMDSAGEGITVTLSTGDFIIDMDKAASPASDVRGGTDDVVLATIKMTSMGEDATVNQIVDSGSDDFIITGTGLACNEIENVEMRDVDSGVIYDISVSSSTSANTCALSMTDEISLTQGVTKTFELRADLLGSNDSNPIDENDTLQVTLANGAMNITGDESDATLSTTPTSVTGATMTVKAADLDWTTVTLDSKTIVPGAEDVVIYKASLDVGESSYVDLTSVKISATSTGVNSFTDNNITKLDLYLNGELLKSKSGAISEGTASPATRAYILFNSLPAGTRRIAAGANNVPLELKATFASSFTSTGLFELGIESATASIVAKDDQNNNVAEDLTQAVNTKSRSVTLAEKGTLKVELKVDDQKANDDTYIVAGAETTTDKYLAELVFTTANEPIVVEELALSQYGTAKNTDISSVNLYDEDGVLVASKAPDANGNVYFDDLDKTFSADQATSLFVGVTTKTINADGDDEGTATFGRTIKFTLATTSTLTALGASKAVKAKGADSSEYLTMSEDSNASVGTNEYSSWHDATSTTATITGSALTSIVNTMDDGVLTGGAGKTIGKFKFTFDNGSNRTSTNEELKAQLVELKLTIATSSAEVSNIQAYIEGDSANKTAAASYSGGKYTLDLDASGVLADSALVDGEVTLVITGTVSGIGSNAYVQTEISSLSGGDFTYNGNNGATGGNITNPQIGISEVIGGTLSN